MSAVQRTPSAHLTSQLPTTSLQFTATPTVDGYKAFEVSEQLLQQILEQAKQRSVQIRGTPSDEAVLVTSSATYSIRVAETSNTIILAHSAAGSDGQKPGASNKENQSINTDEPSTKKQKISHSTACTTPPTVLRLGGFLTHHYELEQIPPRLHVLRDILLKHPYTAAEVEAEVENGTVSEPSVDELYTTEQLQQIIQASDNELQQGLAELGAMELHTHWRLLHPTYEELIFDSLMLMLMEQRYNHSTTTGVNIDSVCNTLATQYPPHITAHVFKQYTQPTSNSPDHYTLNASKVALYRAIQLFKQRESWPHQQFMAAWQDKLPLGMTCDIGVLSGHATHEEMTLLDGSSAPTKSASNGLKRTASNANISTAIDLSTHQWFYFPVTSLSQVLRERLLQMFARKKEWLLEECTPYLQQYCNTTTSLEKLLMKNCRPITQTASNGSKQVLFMKR